MFTLEWEAITWLSKLQTVVALSMIKVEYMAATQVCKEAIWKQKLMEELGHKQQQINVYWHMGVQYHFVREVLKKGSVDMQKIHINDNLADAMTIPINAYIVSILE